MSGPWKRLSPWLPGEHAPRDGESALQALSAVAEVRHLVDQAELAAVRTARRTGRSWTEIATMLAITRQSAWERWRDLDDPAGEPDPTTAPTTAPASAPDRPGPPAPTRRRRTVEVPDVRGLTAAEALGVLTATGLDAESATPEIALLPTPGEERAAVVVRQYPDSGTRVRGASTVRLWLERGDGEAGVREPRRPTPPPRTARAEYDDPAAAAVGAGLPTEAACGDGPR